MTPMTPHSVRDLRINGGRLDNVSRGLFMDTRLTDGELTAPTGSEHTLHDRLEALARNLWWTWQPEVVALFRELDPVRWRELDHNPIALLAEFTPERLEQRADELVLRSPINYAYRRLQEYLSS